MNLKFEYNGLYYATAMKSTGVCRSGQSGQTVTLLAYAFIGSNPIAPT